MRTTIDSAGRIVIPKALRERAGLHAGIPIEISFHDGRVEIQPAEEPSNVRLVRRGLLVVAEPLTPIQPLTVDDVNQVIEEIRREREDV